MESNLIRKNEIKNQRSKNIWLIIAMIVVLTLGFSLTSVLSYLVTKNYVINNALSRTLPLISDNIYSEITKELLDPINVSSLMSNDTFLINWVSDGELDQKQISDYLGTIKNRYGYTSAFFVSDITQKYYYSDGILKTISPENSHDVWYYDFKDSKRSLDLDVDHDEARDGGLTVFINHRLENLDGTLLGVTGVGLEMTDVGQKFLAYQQKFDHEIYLVDGAGIIQIHSNPELVESVNLLERDGIKDIPGSILEPSDQIQIYEYQDSEGLKAISIRYMPEFDWYLIIEKDQEPSLLDARQSLWANILIGLLITFGISILMILIFRAYNKRLEDLASFDELTALYNRRHFSHLMEREISIAQRYGQKLSMLMMDIDNFKSVNDQYGHVIGDEMLRLISKSITKTVRTSDIVGRWGGEEFAVLLSNTGTEEALQIAQRILIDVSNQYLPTAKGTIRRTISIGVSTLDNPISGEDTLVSTSDEALLRAKAKGKNTVSL
jgi:diguanylate cyclase (GGDEF)-like protein